MWKLSRHCSSSSSSACTQLWVSICFGRGCAATQLERVKRASGAAQLWDQAQNRKAGALRRERQDKVVPAEPNVKTLMLVRRRDFCRTLNRMLPSEGLSDFQQVDLSLVLQFGARGQSGEQC